MSQATTGRLAFIAAVAALVLAACSSSPTPTPTPTPSPTPTPTPAPPPDFVAAACPFDVPSGLTVECGTIAVPQVRNDPASGTFNLGVAVFRSVSFPSAPDPVVYLAGGPGENALAGILFIFDEVFAPFLAQRDVIVFDQRGAGFSQPGANCGEFISLAEETLDEALSVDEAIHRGIAASKECRDRLGANGVNLSALNTTESAADVDTLRRALGYETWNLLGISYGTRLAQTVMRDYPEGVRSVILDSTVPIAIDLIAATPASIDRAFQALFDACASDAACSRNYPDLEGVLGTAFDLLNETPVAGRVTNVLRAEEFESVATGNDLVDQLFQGLYSTDVIPLLPELITLAAEGDVGLLDLLRGVSLANFDFISTGMGIAVQCREEAHFTSLEALEAGAADLPDFRRYFSGTQVYGTDLLETCAYWDVDGAPPIENEPVVSGIPTLVLAGEFDPITPPINGEAVAKHLSASTFVLIPSAGHAALTSGGCALEIAQSFLADPGATLDTSCARDVPPPAWVTPIAQVTMVPFQDPFYAIQGVRPEGWEVLLPGVTARSGLGAVSLVQQLLPGISGEGIRRLLSDQIGDGENVFGDPVATLDANGLAWKLYEGATSGQVLLAAFADGEGFSSMIMLTGLPSQRDDLRRHVLGPAVEAFRLVEP